MESDALIVAYLALSISGASTLLVTSIMLTEGWRRREPRRVGRPSVRPYPMIGITAADELEIALREATALNSYSIGRADIPGVRLRDILRYQATDYDVAVREISQHYRQGRVLSIDLGRIGYSQAVRLVDFCSGMSAASSGWILRVAGDVIVLTPGV